MQQLKLALLLLVAISAHATPPAPHYSAAPPTPHYSFQWIGGPTYVLHLGSFKILTDPMFSPKSDTAFVIAKHPTTGEVNAHIRRLIAPAVFDRTNIDLLLISHPHADHFDREAKAALDKQLHVVAPAINKDLIASWGFVNTTGLSWGDSTIIRKGDETLRIIAVEAMHAKDEPLKTQLGKGNGYIIEYSSGGYVYRIYWTGDTVWFDGMEDYVRFGTIDLLIPDMGAVGSDGAIGRRGLNAQDALKIVQTLHPSLVIPVHHSTFSMYVEPISRLQETMDSAGLKKNLKIIKTGETVPLYTDDIPVPESVTIDKGLSPALAKEEKETALYYYAFWNTGRAEYLEKCMDPGFVDHTLPPGRPQGPAGPVFASENFRKAVPDLRCEVKDVLVTGEKVTIRMIFKGTHKGDFMGAKASGKPIEFFAIDILLIQKGKIVEDWHLEDNLTLLQQLGVVH